MLSLAGSFATFRAGALVMATTRADPFLGFLVE
jgi:hypothetical protein